MGVTTMKYIKIFLASSIVEFKQEREEFGTFIRRLNNIYAKRNIYFELVVCEDISKEFSTRRAQDLYNDEIKDSQYFYIIVGKNLGERSLEEFNVALDNYLSTGYPLIMTYFYEVTGTDVKAKSVTDFMERLDKKLSHDYNLFSHFDSIKLDFLMAMHQNSELQSVISFSDGTATVDGEEVMELDNVPIYGKNTSLQDLKKKKEELDKQFAVAAEKYASNPDDNLQYKELTVVSEERARIAETFRKAEADVLSLCVDISKLRSGDNQLTWREKEAIQLTNHGDYEGALAILRDKEREKELKFAENVVDSHLEVIKGYIKENLLRIDTLRSQGLNKERIIEINECYNEIIELSIKYCIKKETIHAYLSFVLDDERDYDKAISFIEELISSYNLQNEFLCEGKIYEALGCAYKGKFILEKAIESYKKAVDYYITSDQKNKWESIINDYGLLVNMYSRLCSYDAALDYVKKIHSITNSYSLSIGTELSAEIRIADFFIELATEYNKNLMNDNVLKEAIKELSNRMYWLAGEYYNKRLWYKEHIKEEVALSYLLRAVNLKADYEMNFHSFEEGLKYRQEVVEIAKKLYQHNTYSRIRELNSAYYSFGEDLLKVKRYRLAAEQLEKAVCLTEEMYQRHPLEYEVYFGNALNLYGQSLAFINEIKDATEVHAKALKIRKSINKHRKNYSYYVLWSTKALADCLSRINKNNEAEVLYREAIDLAKEYTKENGSDTNEVWLKTLDLARFFIGIKQFEEARAFINDALYNINVLSENQSRSWYLYSVAWAGNCFGYLHFEEGDYETAEKDLLSTLENYRGSKNENHPANKVEVSALYFNLANLYYHWGRFNYAEKYATICYCKRSEVYCSEREDLDNYMLGVFCLCGQIYRELNQYKKSEEYFKKALAFADKLYNICPDAFEDAQAKAFVEYAKLLMRTNRIDEANDYCSRAVESYRKLIKIAPKKYKKNNLEANELYLDILKGM